MKRYDEITKEFDYVIPPPHLLAVKGNHKSLEKEEETKASFASRTIEMVGKRISQLKLSPFNHFAILAYIHPLV
jgi:hypothetical protein